MNRYENEEQYFNNLHRKAVEESGDYLKGTRSGAIEDNPELAVERHRDVDYTVGSSWYETSAPVRDTYDDRVRSSEAMRTMQSHPEIRGTGGATFDERVATSEAMRAMQSHPEIRGTGGATFDERVATSEAMAALHREEAKPLREVLSDLINGEFPRNETMLIDQLEKMNVRKDLVKELLEAKSQSLVNNLRQSSSDFSEQTSNKLNTQVYEFLALVSTLKDMGYKLDSKFGEYDPYHAELNLSDISSSLFRRRKNGCSIDIPIPKAYDCDQLQVDIDGVKAVRLVEQAIDGNHVYWEYYGYVAPENRVRKENAAVDAFESARAIQQQSDKLVREEMISGLSQEKGVSR